MRHPPVRARPGRNHRRHLLNGFGTASLYPSGERGTSPRRSRWRYVPVILGLAQPFDNLQANEFAPLHMRLGVVSA